ncbi:hypothetical protein ACFOMD_12520 [Sphingoaurantiacus capsulatus]|uniref:Secreted protein n=1 Tax=Sphingoaurantiacus capsulatus TaxID=1771310 RepID=A0ABV7XDR6_9SPHN
MMRAVLAGLVMMALPVELAAQATTAATTEPGRGATEEKICKKRLEIGSLVRKKKECWTKAEWERIAETEQKGAKRTQDELMGGMRCDAAVQPC